MYLIFGKPIFLYLLLLVPTIVIFHFLFARYSKRRGILFANFNALKRVSKKYAINNHTSLLILRIFVLVSITLVLADTKLVFENFGDSSSYVIGIDNSLSMTSKDNTFSRIEVSKLSSIDFVDSFVNDVDIGVISFASVSKTQSILTQDKYIVKKRISEINYENEYGTNLGDAIMNGVNLLLSKENGKKLILITDGQSNSGVNLIDSLNYALENEIIVYTIGVGSEIGGEIEGIDVKFELNGDILTNISTSTGGRYYNAKTKTELDDAFKSIKEEKYQKLRINLAEPLLVLTLFLLIVEFIFVKTIYKILP